jgi:hypothetical protein
MLAALALAGCGYYHLSPAPMATATPSFTTGQLAELRKREQTPAALGIGSVKQGNATMLQSVNELVATNSVTVPLLRVDAEKPFEEGGHYRMPVIWAKVNGGEKVRLLLDSGSNQNLCGYSLAKQLKLPVVAGLDPVPTYGIGGAVDNRVGLMLELRIGEVELRKLVMLIGPDVQVLRVPQFWGAKPVLLVGVNAFRNLSYLSVDYLRGTMTFGVGDAYRPDSSSQSATHAPLGWNGNLPSVPMTVDERGPFQCLVDTGGDYGLIIPQKRATELGYWVPGSGKVTMSHGVGGVGLDTRYDVKKARIGGAGFDQVPSRTTLAGPEPAGGQLLVGNVVLRRYRITFDFKNSLFWLEKSLVGGRE